MELKDAILSTLAEMEELKPAHMPILEVEKTEPIIIKSRPAIPHEVRSISEIVVIEEPKQEEQTEVEITIKEVETQITIHDEATCETTINSEKKALNGEKIFLNSIRERMLVLFEGFQAPNNTNIESKLDMTLNFLEYVLVTVDSRIDEIERDER